MGNDIAIIGGIVIVFIALGTFLPIINSGFGGDAGTTTTPDAITGEISEYQDSGSLSIWGVLLSVFSMFFWSFGAIWWPVDLILLTPMRIILGVTIARNIWVGGGA